MKLAHSLIVGTSAQWGWVNNLLGNSDEPDTTVPAVRVNTTLPPVDETTIGIFNETTQLTVDFESTTVGFNTTFLDFNTTVEAATTKKVNETTTIPTTAKVIGTTVIVTTGEQTTNKFHTTDETTSSELSTTGLFNGTTVETTTGFFNRTTVEAKSTARPPITVTYFTTAKPSSDLSRCERMRFDVLNSGMVGAWVPSCDEKGRFEPRQCNNSARTCWFVRPNGEMIDDTQQFLPEWNLERVRCRSENEHSQDGLNLWDINIHEIISDWLSGDSKEDTGAELVKDWLSQSGAANINFAPQNTNVQNFINVNTQVSADINFNMAGKDVNLSDILFRLARHGKNEELMWKEFEKCLDEFDIKSHVHEYWPMIKKFAEKYGLDEKCLSVLEEKLMESF